MNLRGMRGTPGRIIAPRGKMQGAGLRGPGRSATQPTTMAFCEDRSARPWLSSPTFCPTWTSTWRLICFGGKTTLARPMYSGARSWLAISCLSHGGWGPNPPFPSQLLHPRRRLESPHRLRRGAHCVASFTTAGCSRSRTGAILSIDASFQTEEDGLEHANGPSGREA